MNNELEMIWKKEAVFRLFRGGTVKNHERPQRRSYPFDILSGHMSNINQNFPRLDFDRQKAS
jgi:hypothetical protein